MVSTSCAEVGQNATKIRNNCATEVVIDQYIFRLVFGFFNQAQSLKYLKNQSFLNIAVKHTLLNLPFQHL